MFNLKSIIFTDVWGFDDEAVKVLKDMKPPDTDELVHKFAILLNCNSELLPQNSDGKLNVSIND